MAWSFSTLLSLAFALAYLRMSIEEPDLRGFIEGFGSDVLLRFGALWREALEAEPWRLGTATFLHIGLLHLAFNTLALLQVGPTIEDLYGRWALPGFFLVTGVLANLASLAMGLEGVQAGASGGLMGLTGIAAGWGQRQGTTLGRDIRNRMLQWCAYTLLFGFFVHADNVAHAGGFVSGLVLGFAVRPEAMKRFGRSTMSVPAAVVSAAAVVVLLGLVLFPMKSRAHWRQALQRPVLSSDALGSTDDDAFPDFSQLAQPCLLQAKGEQARAQALARLTPGFEWVEAGQLQGLCQFAEWMRERCERVQRDDWEGLLPAAQGEAERERTRTRWLRRCAPAR
ncbi:MAG: rhomboid family intramembrane serine protease [Myxococcales bacterium]